MKILHIIDSGGLYGAETVLLNLAEEQIKQGLDTTIASIGEKKIKVKPIETEAIRRGIKVEKFRMLPGPNIIGMWKVLKFAKNNRFNIVHSHGYKGNVSLGFIPRRLRQIPLVTTLHGYTSTAGISKNRIYEWLDLKSIKHIDAVVVVNRSMLNNPRLSKIKNAKFHAINNGIPLVEADVISRSFSCSSIDPHEQKIREFCQKGFIIGSIGRLSTEKGFNFLIDAFALIIKKVVDAKLIIFGEGYKRESLEKLISQYDLKDKVLMPGYFKDARKYIPFFNIFIISSLTEGLPVTLLEAMQARRPIIATKVGGIPEVLSNGGEGVLIDSCNPDAIMQAVIRLYEDKGLCNQLIVRAYNKVTEDYSSKRMTARYMDVYNDLVNG